MNLNLISYPSHTTRRQYLLASVAIICGCSFALNAHASGQAIADKPGYKETAPAAIASSSDAAPVAWAAEHEDAVRTARGGDTTSALKVLKKLHTKHPEDLGVTRDYLVVSSWAGHNNEVIELYKTLGDNQPDYVLQAVAQSYRDLKQPSDAMTVYRQGLKAYPGNAAFAAGEIRGMADENNAPQALELANKNLKAHGDRVDILLAASYAAQANKEGVESLRYCFRAVHLDPASRVAQHDLINAIDFIGAPQEAIERADASPGILSPEEYRRLKGDEVAAAVRWDALEAPSEKERFAAADKAIAALDTLIAGWSKQGDVTKANVLRARFDRLIAFHDRFRMKDVIAEYDDMTAHGIKVPTYALNAVGDAYLYLHQPEKARDIYLQVLKDDPNNFDANMQLFYAYAETDDFHAAYKQIDTLAANKPIWIYLKGDTQAQPNPERAAAELTAGYARFYGEDYAKAEERIGTIAAAAGGNAAYHSAIGEVYESRGWPRSAQEQYQIGTAMMQGHDVSSETGSARVNLELQNYQIAESETADLTQRFPENLDVQRAKRIWDVHNLWELDVDAEKMFRSSSNLAGGAGVIVDTRLYTPPIDYNWRIFAEEFWGYEDEPSGEGDIHLSGSSVGLEYRGHGVTASIAPTFNYYNSDAIGTTGNDRVGGDLKASYAINDRWTVGTQEEIFSRDTPLRAINAGVTADSEKVDAIYRVSESRELDLNAEFMQFSDEDLRSMFGAAYKERLYTNPYWKIDGLVDVSESNNSLDEIRLYYNPKTDLMGLAGLNISQILYRHYELVYEHSLRYTPGAYWESGFGTSLAQVAEYKQTLHVNDVFETSLGVVLSRQDYDGIPENDVSLIGNLVYRF